MQAWVRVRVRVGPTHHAGVLQHKLDRLMVRLQYLHVLVQVQGAPQLVLLQPAVRYEEESEDAPEDAPIGPAREHLHVLFPLCNDHVDEPTHGTHLETLLQALRHEDVGDARHLTARAQGVEQQPQEQRVPRGVVVPDLVELFIVQEKRVLVGCKQRASGGKRKHTHTHTR
jgi:hypothetical protein